MNDEIENGCCDPIVTSTIKDNKLIIFLKGYISSAMEREIALIVSYLDYSGYEKVDIIELRINSYGGSVAAAFGIIDSLKESGKILHTVISGVAASCGALLFLQGTVRKCYQHSILMIHNPSGGDDEAVLELFKESLIFLMQPFYKSKEELSKLMDAETWYSAKDMVRVGIVDKENVMKSTLKTKNIKNTKELFEITNSYIDKNDEEIMDKEKTETIETEEVTNSEEVTETTTEEVTETEEVTNGLESDETKKVDKDTEEVTVEDSAEEVADVEPTELENALSLITNMRKELDELKNEKITKEKEEILNGVTFLEDKSAWMDLDKDIIKNLLGTIKSKNVQERPVITDSIKNDMKFEDLSIPERQEIANSNPELFGKLVEEYNKK